MSRCAPEAGVDTEEDGRERFLQLAGRFMEASDSLESARLREELARPVFGG
jgi:hypothetical protein